MLQYDEGGPLVIYRFWAWVQVGILTRVSPAGCTAGVPAVYTRLSSYRTWILETTGLLG
jgi:secreted trypsin-like serine protease